MCMAPQAAGVYARISQDRGGAGLGVARQEQDCRAWAESHGWTVAEVYVDDDVSAYSGKPRPAYARMVEAIKAGERDGLIVWHPDRLTRVPRELEDVVELVEATGIPVGTVTAGNFDLGTATGRMVARVVGATARYESEHKSERIKRKALEIAQAGGVPGGGRRAFGYEQDGLTVRESEATLIREAAERVLAGDGVRTVAADWQARGVPTVTGAVWASTTIKRMLLAGKVVGWRTLHGQRVAKGAWPAILDEETQRKLRRILEDPARTTNGKGGRAPSYLLSGMLTCGACGATLTARPVVRKGHRYRRYACVVDRGGCNRNGIAADPLEALVVDALFLRLGTGAVGAAVAKRQHPKQTVGGVEAIEAELKSIAEERARGEISKAEWAAMRGPLLARLDDAKSAEVAEIRAEQLPAEMLAPGALRKAWPDLGFDRQRVVLSSLIKTVVVTPTTRSNNKFDPGRADIRWHS